MSENNIYDYDVVVIGLGPAGMAVSVMASEIGLKVCGIEKNKIGGECMNVGCIPSKAILRLAKKYHVLKEFSVTDAIKTDIFKKPFPDISKSLQYISDKKTMGMFEKVKLIYQQGEATFLDPHTIKVGEQEITGKRIFICTGTRPAIPNISGLKDIEPLTNENLYSLEEIPESMIVLGSGAIACEMAQAFARLGTKVSMVFRGKGLLWREDKEVGTLLEKSLNDDGVILFKNAGMKEFIKDNNETILELEDGTKIKAQKVLCALGRHFDAKSLNLENAGVNFSKKGITVNNALQTSQKHIFACGDINGEYQFSHAAMHQGMLALMNCFMPPFYKMNFKKYPVPWTIFTEPQISRVGASLAQLEKDGIAHEVITVRYEDYGAAIAEKIETGFVKVAVNKWGKILGVTIVGEGSGEMINEWAMAIQNKHSLIKIMLQQHSFPTMGFLSKRVAEVWMMKKMQSVKLKNMCRSIFNFYK